VRIARLLPYFLYLGAPYSLPEPVAEGAADRHSDRIGAGERPESGVEPEGRTIKEVPKT
jgi:hypothetical protein